jgi:hypothetical protein
VAQWISRHLYFSQNCFVTSGNFAELFPLFGFIIGRKAVNGCAMMAQGLDCTVAIKAPIIRVPHS